MNLGEWRWIFNGDSQKLNMQKCRHRAWSREMPLRLQSDKPRGDRLPKPIGFHILLPWAWDARPGTMRFSVFHAGFLSYMSPTLPFCLSFFSICCDFRKSNKNNFREKVFLLAHSSRVCSVIKRKPRQQGVKAAGYITSTVKNKAMSAYSAGFLSANRPGPLPTSINRRIRRNLQRLYSRR